MERDYENKHRQQSRIVINDYPSSHLPPEKRPKLWGERSKPAAALPARPLTYIERPCLPRDTTAFMEPSQKTSSTDTAAPRPSSGGDRCKLDSDFSGVSAPHCSPCYTSSALSGGNRSSGSSAQTPDTAGEPTQLSVWVSKQMEKAALSGCGSEFKPTTTAKPVTG